MQAQTIALLIVLAPISLIGPAARAEQAPVPGKNDIRIRYVNYSKDDVTLISVQRGTVTRIVLAEGEKILRDGSATGFSADCARVESEWCMRADVGMNQILVKPKDGATHNNLELRTDRRDYSIAFEVLPDASRLPAKNRKQVIPMYRVMFRYPGEGQDVASPDPLRERLAQAKPRPRNWKYTMQPAKGSNDIIPSLVFDDGRFTYFRFPANREFPAIFAIADSGEEAKVNFHIEENDDSLVVVERTSRRFALRLGTAVVGIWNENFDAYANGPNHGTTVNGAKRELRQGGSRGR